jgi:hypothetical protein
VRVCWAKSVKPRSPPCSVTPGTVPTSVSDPHGQAGMPPFIQYGSTTGRVQCKGGGGPFTPWRVDSGPRRTRLLSSPWRAQPASSVRVQLDDDHPTEVGRGFHARFVEDTGPLPSDSTFDQAGSAKASEPVLKRGLNRPRDVRAARCLLVHATAEDD